jgi:hypothetical protein
MLFSLNAITSSSVNYLYSTGTLECLIRETTSIKGECAIKKVLLEVAVQEPDVMNT